MSLSHALLTGGLESDQKERVMYWQDASGTENKLTEEIS